MLRDCVQDGSVLRISLLLQLGLLHSLFAFLLGAVLAPL